MIRTVGFINCFLRVLLVYLPWLELLFLSPGIDHTTYQREKSIALRQTWKPAYLTVQFILSPSNSIAWIWIIDEIFLQKQQHFTMRSFVSAMISASEKAALIARACRQEDDLFQMLIQVMHHLKIINLQMCYSVSHVFCPELTALFRITSVGEARQGQARSNRSWFQDVGRRTHTGMLWLSFVQAYPSRCVVT